MLVRFCRVTFVQSYMNYWVGINSPVIYDGVSRDLTMMQAFSLQSATDQSCLPHRKTTKRPTTTTTTTTTTIRPTTTVGYVPTEIVDMFVDLTTKTQETTTTKRTTTQQATTTTTRKPTTTESKPTTTTAYLSEPTTYLYDYYWDTTPTRQAINLPKTTKQKITTTTTTRTTMPPTTTTILPEETTTELYMPTTTTEEPTTTTEIYTTTTRKPTTTTLAATTTTTTTTEAPTTAEIFPTSVTYLWSTTTSLPEPMLDINIYTTNQTVAQEVVLTDKKTTTVVNVDRMPLTESVTNLYPLEPTTVNVVSETKVPEITTKIIEQTTAARVPTTKLPTYPNTNDPYFEPTAYMAFPPADTVAQYKPEQKSVEINTSKPLNSVQSLATRAPTSRSPMDTVNMKVPEPYPSYPPTDGIPYPTYMPTRYPDYPSYPPTDLPRQYPVESNKVEPYPTNPPNDIPSSFSKEQTGLYSPTGIPQQFDRQPVIPQQPVSNTAADLYPTLDSVNANSLPKSHIQQETIVVKESETYSAFFPANNVNKDIVKTNELYTPTVPPTAEVRIPATANIRIPSTADSRIPATSDGRNPTTADSGIPATADARIPVTADSRIPTTAYVRIPTTGDFNIPATADFKIPTTTNSRIPTTADVMIPPTADSRIPTTVNVSKHPTAETSAPVRIADAYPTYPPKGITRMYPVQNTQVDPKASTSERPVTLDTNLFSEKKTSSVVQDYGITIDNVHLTFPPQTLTPIMVKETTTIIPVRDTTTFTFTESSTALPTTRKTTLPPITRAPELRLIPDVDCGVTQGCFDDCKHGICTFIVSWKPDKESTQFEIRTKPLVSGAYWAAVGFSDDKMMVGIPLLLRFVYCSRR